MGWSVFVPFFVLSLTVGVNCGSFLITAPSTAQPGSQYDVSVDILNGTDVEVVATLQSRTYNGTIRDYVVTPVDSVSNTFSTGSPGKLTFDLDPSLRCNDCRLHIRGKGGLQFERSKHVSISNTVVVILIQTDKAMYKPGQLVRFRVFAVYPDLSMYQGALNIEIKDPNNNKIKVMSGQVAGQFGVVQGELQLGDQPQFGDWSIRAVTDDTRDSHVQSFTVANYELPRFEINVELPPFGLRSDRSLTGKVTAKYTFGQDVKGRVELHVGRDQAPDSCGNGPRTTQISFDIDGMATFEIPKDSVQRAVSIRNGVRVKVTAFVTEEATGVRLNGSSVITYYQKDSKIQFLDNTPGVFKPGLPYTAYIQATTPDGKSPPTGSDQKLSVYTTVKYSLEVPDQSFYSISKFTGRYPLPGENITLPASGVVPVSVEIPNNATSIEIKTTFRGITATKTIQKTWSPSNNFLRLTLLDSNVQSRSQVQIKMECTEPLNAVQYEVISRGTKALIGSADGQGQKSLILDLTVTPDMSPVAHVLAYYSRENSEIVADSLAFEVDGLFHNEVSVRFNTNESQPNEQVEVQLIADPSSLVNVLAVDQSVLLLKSGNDITPDKVKKSVSVFDRSGRKPSDPEFALAHNSKDVKGVFENLGLLVFSDVNMEEPRVYDAYLEEDLYPVPGMYDAPPMSMARPGPPGMRSRNFARKESGRTATAVKVERIRQVFPEAWLWEQTPVGENGTASLTTRVPDTITSWIVSAVATNPNTGLGVAPTTAKLRVFRPFFVSLNYPGTVTRGEHIVVQATIFNYLPSDVPVLVKLRENAGFQSIHVDRSGVATFGSGHQDQRINVASGEQGVVYFPIVPTQTGLLEIEITAQSTLAADGVRRMISVQPEGAPVSYNTPLFINIENNQTFIQTVNFTLPPSTVVGSTAAKVKVTGDIIGSSLDGLTSLLELPTGCGEQSMVKFAPDLSIAKYLRASNQLTPGVWAHIQDLLNTGYQRQLSFQRYDKSFSAFGNNDPTGNTWLTAMVAGTFAEARDFIYIDTNVISRAVDWLVDRQSLDGTFSSFGKVLDPNTQRARSHEGLTAYVVSNLLQAMSVAENDVTRHRWGNASARAVALLESRVASNSVQDPLSLAMVSYALSLARSSQSEVALNQLYSINKTEGGLIYWEDVNSRPTARRPSASQYTIWRPPVVQARPADILITSYAILAMTASGKIQEAYPSVQWLAAQRNSKGGFASSQDTTVGLQALAAYATASSRPDTDLTVNVVGNADSGSATFSVNNDNAWTLQSALLNNFPTSAYVEATGTGFGLLEMVYSFNVLEELSTPSFDVSTVMLDDDVDSFNLMICTKWLWERDTGMVVQEISIPSGFNPDLTSIGNVAGLQKTERRGNTVAVYFDKIGKSSLCYSLIMTRTAKVAKSQKSFVRTFDYYQPSDQSTVFYSPRRLRESTICDVCDGCCP